MNLALTKATPMLIGFIAFWVPITMDAIDEKGVDWPSVMAKRD
jgi:hypothetical protein